MFKVIWQVRLSMLGRTAWLGGIVALAAACKVCAQTPSATPDTYTSARCLPDGSGYFRARLSGILETELDWGSAELTCTGAVRPTDQGIRMRFVGHTPQGEQLAFVIGIARLREGKSAKALPVNVTLIREGLGQFYGTRGDDKCMLDQVTQHPLVGIPRRSRLYRVVARGFCIEPARAVAGPGSILISRFDYAGRVDFGEEVDPTAPTAAPGSTPLPTKPDKAPEKMPGASNPKSDAPRRR
jgi:hypothetical protein